MVKNDGSVRNDEAFWNTFCSLLGEHVRNDEPVFDDFYHNEFQKAKEVCGFTPESAKIVHTLKEAGYKVILATNPLFPAIATESRIRWAGLKPEDFEYYTVYDNSYHCKPNPDYYQDIIDKLNLNPEECLMVGNDVDEDMIAETLGMNVFLLTDSLINKSDKDISQYPHGSFHELIKYLDL
jgi:HAD superfamily hydrolase (TIGR01549 family)